MSGFETKVASVDARIARFTDALTALYSERLRAVYLTGSWREGTAVAGSDLDVVVVLHGLASQHDTDELVALTATFNAEDGPVLGPFGIDDDELAAPLPTYLKHAALLWGEDVFADSPEMTAAQTHRRWARGTLRLFASLRRPPGGDASVDPSRWSGYALGSLESPRLKLVVSAVARAAGARAAARGVNMPSKSACCLRYREVVGGEYSDTVERVYQALKLDWGYGWPTSPADLERLGALCAEVAALERRFYGEVATWLEEARASGDAEDVEWANRCALFIPPDATVSHRWGEGDAELVLWHDRASRRWWMTSERGVEALRMFARERGGFDVLVDFDERDLYHLGWGGRLERSSDGRVWESDRE